MIKFLLIVLFMASCGRPQDVTVNNIEPTNCEHTPMPGTVEYNYSFTRHGCSTGCHVSYSVKDYCAQLLDDALNNYCAKQERKEAFEQSNCPH